MNTYEFSTFLIGILLRLIVPVGATAFGVWLLRRLDDRWQSDALKRAVYMSGKTIPLENLACWDVHECSPERKANCVAYQNQNLPCWEVHQVNGQLQEACQNCAFHKMKVRTAKAVLPAKNAL